MEGYVTKEDHLRVVARCMKALEDEHELGLRFIEASAEYVRARAQVLREITVAVRAMRDEDAAGGIRECFEAIATAIEAQAADMERNALTVMKPHGAA